MLDQVIKIALRNRMLVMAAAVLLLIAGVWTGSSLPVDVLPDLNRPRVTIFLEAEGMAPEEIEWTVVQPIETAMNGASGVEGVRSTAVPGLGMVFVEFGYAMEIMMARQIVTEKMMSVALPPGIRPVLGPITSVMGQIMLVGVTSDTTTPAQLRSLADNVLRPRLLSVQGVSQVIPIGGDVLQYQIMLSIPKLNAAGLSIAEVEAALAAANKNSSGNFIEREGTEILVRNLGRMDEFEEMRNLVVGEKDGTSVLLSQVAELIPGTRQKRGDASLNAKPAVILSIEKQPEASTLELTQAIEEMLGSLNGSLPADVMIEPEVFKQANFIQASISNVEEALRDGAILVVLILFLFLLNVRTTLISLVAIPLSLVMTALIFRFLGLGINTMTLGGVAIAIGELVDDAIVDVENVFRRLRENRLAGSPTSALKIVFAASSEVRNSIVYATIIVVLVFLPLFWLEGMEGKIFMPLGIAYITSIVASLLVSMTVTPVMCYLLLPNMKMMAHERESFLVRWLKRWDAKLLERVLQRPRLVLIVAGILFVGAMALLPFFGTEFLPPFNEGSLTISLQTEAGTSLNESNLIASIAERQVLKVPEVEFTARRTGRAELDEHAEPVSSSEIDVAFKKETTGRSQSEVLADIREKLSLVKGASINIGQPISHRLDHLLSGVRAQVVVRLFGPQLEVLKTQAERIKAAMAPIPGVVDLQVERQSSLPQLNIKPNPVSMRNYGLKQGELTKVLEMYLKGEVVSYMVKGLMRYEVAMRLPLEQRNSVEEIKRMMIETPNGKVVPLGAVAEVYFEDSPNSISHENGQRRILISCNIAGADLGSSVQEIQERISALGFPEGYYVNYAGQFERQQSASRMILFLSMFSFLGIFLVLLSHFRSERIVLQIMLNIPLSLIGSVVAVQLTGGVLSVASLVGFITLTGIASRNGIMMISHYIHLMEHEGETFGPKMIIRGSLERLIPVMMTALVAALALIPLVMSKDAPGKELLYPVASVILGGLLSSTLLDMLVTPAAFYLFGKKGVEKYLARQRDEEL